MAERKPDLIESGDQAIPTVQAVKDYGAYADLEEIRKRGLFNDSGISSFQSRNNLDFVGKNREMAFFMVHRKHADDIFQRISQSFIAVFSETAESGTFRREK